MTLRKAQPRVAPDVGMFYLTLALGIRQRMLTRHGDGRELGMGEAMRLYLVHQGELPLPSDPDALHRLDALREVLMTTREAPRGRGEAGAPAHG